MKGRSRAVRRAEARGCASTTSSCELRRSCWSRRRRCSTAIVRSNPICAVFVTKPRPAHRDFPGNVYTVDVIHCKGLGVLTGQLDGMEMHTGGDIRPEVVVAGVYGVVAEAPVDGGSCRFEKCAMRVENRGKRDERVNVLLTYIKEILKTATMIPRIGKMTPLFQLRDSFYSLNRIIISFGI